MPSDHPHLRAPTSQHLSLRVRPELHERLTHAAQRSVGVTRSSLAARLLDEGLRMESHPGIVFRDGPAGRRPGLAAGPDVWEVARVVRDVEASGEEALRETTRLTGLALHQVRAVAGYYREFSDEIDQWIDDVDREADRAAAESATA